MTTTIDGVNTIQIRNAKNGDFEIYYNAGTSSNSLSNNQIVAYIEHSANGVA